MNEVSFPPLLDITFIPTDDVKQKDLKQRDIGKILEIIHGNDGVTVRAEHATLKFARPELANPQAEVNARDYGLAYDSLEKVKGGFENDLYVLMSLLHQVGREMKKGAREARAATREAQMEELLNAADKVRDAAAKALAAGITSGVFQIAGGAAQIAGGAGAFKGKTGTLDSSTTIGRGLGEGLQGLGGIGESILNYYAKLDEAEQKEHEAAATKAQSLSESEKEMMDNARDLLSAIQDFLKSTTEARAKTSQAIVRA